MRLCETCEERGKESAATHFGAFGAMCSPCYRGEPSCPEEETGVAPDPEQERRREQWRKDKTNWRRKSLAAS